MIFILSKKPNDKISFLILLLTPLPRSLTKNVWGYVLHGTRIIV